MKKRVCMILSLILLIIGLFLIEPKTTGAVIGATSNSIIGILLILISGILFVVREEESVLEKEVKRKHELPESIGEAIDKGVLKQYLAGKKLVSETNLPPETYSKHTKFIDKKVSEDYFLTHVGKEAQYLPKYTLKEIREFERKIALKGRGHSKGSHVAIVYGISHPGKYGPTGAGIMRKGAKKGEKVFGVRVELQERPQGIYIHGHPIPIKDIPEEIRKEIRKKKG